MTSLDRLFRTGTFVRSDDAAPRPHPLISSRGDRDEVRGKIEGAPRGGESQANLRLGKSLDARLGARGRFGFRERRRAAAFDPRQRVIVKVHFFGHAGGGAAALKAHARYVARDAALRDLPDDRLDGETNPHARGPERAGRRGVFYDGIEEGVDGARRIAVWAHEDRRHFRVMLAAENGAALRDLKALARDVMERAEAMLGTRLEWVAIDHWDTDNPHTHVVLRGRRQDGRPLVLPRDFVTQGMRSIARDAVTERLGARTPADERSALLRQARAHRPTRLDAYIERALRRNFELRIADLSGRAGDAGLEVALKTRARELARLGLANAIRRNVLAFRPDWCERLALMEQHLDIRKSLLRQRAPALKLQTSRDLKRGRGLDR